MANTYTQIHLHLVFAVQNRISLIHDSWKSRLHEYLTAIVHNHKHKMIAINSIPDHLHLVIGMRPMQAVSDLLFELKRDSSRWINKNNFVKGRFQWQDGYGAFSVAKSNLPDLVKYVQNQEIHHSSIPFLEEYKSLLNEFDVNFDERYLFREIE
ncbi:MAG: IS200/IS605 family transposase [Ginsengibacter sp.]